MDILPELVDMPQFKQVKHYLQSDDGLKLYQIANEVADLFDQYTLYRPDMILDWEARPDANYIEYSWQQILWSHFVKRIQKDKNTFDAHRAQLFQNFREVTHEPGFDNRKLPSRIFLFGISSLPPYHLAVLANLAQYIDLHLFIMNPCREFWFDIIADRDIAKISRESISPEESLHLDKGNSLLSSMGHLGRDFLTMVQELDCEDIDIFHDPGSESLLSCIQQDILYLQETTEPQLHLNAHKKRISNQDMSITFQSCHSPMREVEVLHDNLLHFLDQHEGNKLIEPRDILVMAPDINMYAPLIDAVFGADNKKAIRTPYSISDQSIKNSSKYITTFFEILTTLKSRFTSINILDLLKAEPIKNQFSINDHDIVTLENWINETRICWGIDQKHKNVFDLPNHAENTWRAGLDRLLLGYATPGENRKLFKNILPFDLIEGNDTKLLGNFLEFTEILFALSEEIRHDYTLSEWSEILIRIKENLLLADDTSISDENLLLQSLNGLNELQFQTKFNKSISINVLHSYLLNSLEQKHTTLSGAKGFLTGGITFCSMLPMRTIPFKIICLLGMNDGKYPRTGRKRSFNLMTLNPRKGDRSRRYDDRYLFLETILSAREKLYISFEGQSLQDGSTKPPSVLVSELMDYIETGYEIENSKNSAANIINHIRTNHRLQPFHPDYFSIENNSDDNKLFSYSTENCAAAEALTSGLRGTSPVATRKLPVPPDSYKEIELTELINFFTHPARFFLTRMIGIAPIGDTQKLSTSEPFTLKGLDRYKLENDILKKLVNNQAPEEFYQIKKAAGELPHGKVGEVQFARIVSELQRFKSNIDRLLNNLEPQTLEINLPINGFNIYGRLENITETGMVQYRYAALKPKDMIRGWINHLVFNAYNRDDCTDSENTTFLAGKDKVIEYKPNPECIVYLEQLLDLYWHGLSEPLHFFPLASYAYARKIFKGGSKKAALLKAKGEWEGSAYSATAEMDDPYNYLCFKDVDPMDDLFTVQSEKIFLPILKSLAR
jgi:exodeoxyribonuclease V gamma subunit